MDVTWDMVMLVVSSCRVGISLLCVCVLSSRGEQFANLEMSTFERYDTPHSNFLLPSFYINNQHNNNYLARN